MCPGIITIIWSLITSDTTGTENQDGDGADNEPDDSLTELLNNDLTREAIIRDIQEKDSGITGIKSKKAAPIDIKTSSDIFSANA